MLIIYIHVFSIDSHHPPADLKEGLTYWLKQYFLILLKYHFHFRNMKNMITVKRGKGKVV